MPGSISVQSQGTLALGEDNIVGNSGNGALYIYFGGLLTFAPSQELTSK